MNLTKQKLQVLWLNRNQIFNDEKNKRLVERFKEVSDLFEQILKMEILIEEKIVKVNDEIVCFEDENTPDLGYFGCANDEMCQAGAMNGVIVMKESLNKQFADLIIKIGCLLGGFDFQSIKNMRSEYRLVSSTITGKNDNGSLSVEQMSKKMSSNLADNNYFFWVIKTIQDIKNGIFNPKESHIVLVYPHEAYFQNWDEAEKNQKISLEFRFPYKFFYMWAKKDEVIHPFSLMAYKNIVQQSNDELNFKVDENLSLGYSKFTDEWKKYSEKILEIVREKDQQVDFNELSKLLSIIMVQDQDIKNIRDLIETGNKSIILFGPPGTGKTYQAQQLVKDLLKIKDDEKTDDYLFRKNDDKYENGCYSLIQFHPNYTYEDFMCGISPNLENNGQLSYVLKEGIFKRMCDTARMEENIDKKFILIIDEINRADLSSVFGELLFALEYRNNEINIPNVGKFTIPENVYLIGTMNNVDKSLVTMDLALRRRFGFYKVMPNTNIIYDILSNYNIDEENLNYFVLKCEQLNKTIKESQTLMLGIEYQIGHAYFGKIKDFLPDYAKNKIEDKKLIDGNSVKITSFDMEKLWVYHLEPLLEEYIGGKIEDDSIQKKITKIKNDFLM